MFSRRGSVLVVLARVGMWRQAFVSDRMIRFFAWALAAVFLLEALAAFTWGRGEELWWLYGPVSLVIAALALIVARSGGAWPRLHRTSRVGAGGPAWTPNSATGASRDNRSIG
jgi:peptidoglycan/LPS O-acetylase OafA/YrhL